MSKEWMEYAVQLAINNVRSGTGGPFGAIIVQDNNLIAEGVNLVTVNHDPTAHAEVVAIRAACNVLGTFQLQNCEIYSSCEPCPMCLGAIYWARLKACYFASNRHAAAQAGFDDAFIYDEINLPPAGRSIPGIESHSEIGALPFQEWMRSSSKIEY